jgi:hypothetical protein
MPAQVPDQEQFSPVRGCFEYVLVENVATIDAQGLGTGTSIPLFKAAALRHV